MALTLVVPPAWAADRDPLLEVLIRKGILTPAEADQVQKEAKALEKEKEKKVDNKVANSEQKVTTEVDQKVAAVEKKVEAKTSAWPEGLSPVLKGWQIGVLAFLGYTVGDTPTFMGPPLKGGTAAHPLFFGRNNDGHVGINQFYLERGYLNISKEITPWLFAFSTTDLTQYKVSNTVFNGGAAPKNTVLDAESGDWKIRQKYLYAEFRPGNLGTVLTQIKSDVGLTQNPWHPFEESLYPYRLQGTIPIERAGILNSSDLGVSFQGNFGPELANAQEVLGGTLYDGRYGSWMLGAYNGSGYKGVENKPDKPLEYRASFRPLPDILPGFQATYFGIYGKGNSSSANNFGPPYEAYFPNWIVHLGHLSYQHPWFTLTAQIIADQGNQAGNWTEVPPSQGGHFGNRAYSLWTREYSAFGDVKVPLTLWSWNADPKFPLHVFARMDWFNADQNHVYSDSAKYTKLITGIGYYLYKKNMISISYEKTWYGRDYAVSGGTGIDGSTNMVVSPVTNGSNLGTDQRLEVVYQLNY